MTDEDPRDFRSVFEATYTAPASRVQEEVWRSVFGDEYPTGLDPYSFVTRSELARFARDLRVGPGSDWWTSVAVGAVRACGWRPRPVRG